MRRKSTKVHLTLWRRPLTLWDKSAKRGQVVVKAWKSIKLCNTLETGRRCGVTHTMGQYTQSVEPIEGRKLIHKSRSCGDAITLHRQCELRADNAGK
ncbi:hypothetical protein Syun_014852 [Stephania yunnanensis]|uniref:Uncharacterized protein n=1 Tax=Stephania yunnanensis TaxID=152371 RepID=A0AAP0JKA3_9MAGN